MNEDGIKRLPRLTAILTLLQSKKLLTAAELADKFSVSKRTIYRDIKALEQSGIPIITEEGRGYALMDNYRVPPVRFSESEANALITAEQLILQNKDVSFVSEYTKAIDKIKSVLHTNTRDKANFLSTRITSEQTHNKTSNYLATLQLALTNFNLVEIKYYSPTNDQKTERIVEPFALHTHNQNWLLIAFCRKRNDFRAFRLDRIRNLSILNQTFEPHNITFEEYYNLCQIKCSPPLP